jgi:hypothetical protein
MRGLQHFAQFVHVCDQHDLVVEYQHALYTMLCPIPLCGFWVHGTEGHRGCSLVCGKGRDRRLVFWRRFDAHKVQIMAVLIFIGIPTRKRCVQWQYIVKVVEGQIEVVIHHVFLLPKGAVRTPRRCPPGAMFRSSGRCTGKGQQPIGFQHIVNFEKRLFVVRVVFKAFGGYDGIKRFIGKRQLTRFGDNGDIGGFDHIVAVVFATLKQVPIVAVDVARTHIQDALVQERIWGDLFDEKGEVVGFGMHIHCIGDIFSD